jgi:hypothetical protein
VQWKCSCYFRRLCHRLLDHFLDVLSIGSDNSLQPCFPFAQCRQDLLSWIESKIRLTFSWSSSKLLTGIHGGIAWWYRRNRSLSVRYPGNKVDEAFLRIFIKRNSVMVFELWAWHCPYEVRLFLLWYSHEMPKHSQELGDSNITEIIARISASIWSVGGRPAGTKLVKDWCSPCPELVDPSVDCYRNVSSFSIEW